MMPETTETPRIILITGNMAAGKSSVAQAVAERLPRSVHLRGDVFRRMIVGGRAEMGFELSAEALAQLHLRYRLSARAAMMYADAGFTVVYQDVIVGPALADVVALYPGYPLSVVVLCPRPEIIAAREAGRGKTGYPDEAAVVAFDHLLRTATPRLGYWLDSSEQTIDETAEDILAHIRSDHSIDPFRHPPVPSPQQEGRRRALFCRIAYIALDADKLWNRISRNKIKP